MMNGPYLVIKRIVLALALAVIITAVVPVTAQAAEDSSDWIELLETATVDDAGNNLFTLAATSGTFRIKTPQYMRCTKVDMLIAHPSGATPTSVKVRYNNAYYTLTMAQIDAYTTRVYGANIPDTLYADLVFQINKTGTSSVAYQILSCRVTSLTGTELKASAYAEINGMKYNAPFSFSYDDPDGKDYYDHYQFPVVVTDWQKYDKITISGSCGYMALNSIRCTIGGLGLPYEMSYAVSNSTGSEIFSFTWNEMKYYTYDESYKGSSETESYLYTEYRGKTLFTITIDLTGVDRTSTEHMWIFFTTLAHERLGYTIQILQVTGTVEVADTSQMSWWNRFTSFMTNLFGGKDPEADQFESDMEQAGNEFQDAQDQMDAVTKPPIEDVPLDPSQFLDPAGTQQSAMVFQVFFGNSLVVTLVSIALIVALAAFIIF